MNLDKHFTSTHQYVTIFSFLSRRDVNTTLIYGFLHFMKMHSEIILRFQQQHLNDCCLIHCGGYQQSKTSHSVHTFRLKTLRENTIRCLKFLLFSGQSKSQSSNNDSKSPRRCLPKYSSSTNTDSISAFNLRCHDNL